MPGRSVFGAIDAALAEGRPVALVTIVRALGSTPQRVGARMLVYEDGTILGTIGGGCYEQDAAGKARLAIATGRSSLVHYDLNDDFAEEQGLVCGGQMDVFVDPLLPIPRLCVMGAGHVGVQVARLAAQVGFSVTVVDDRTAFADPARLPGADRVDVAEIPQWIETAALTPRDYLVIVTRGHREDLAALRAAAACEAAYVGLIGSRAKIARLYTLLEEEGVSRAALDAVHAPIGLDIGAVTPEEIAVSIVAEVVAHRRGKLAARGTGDQPPSVASLRWSPPPRQPAPR